MNHNIENALNIIKLSLLILLLFVDGLIGVFGDLRTYKVSTSLLFGWFKQVPGIGSPR